MHKHLNREGGSLLQSTLARASNYMGAEDVLLSAIAALGGELTPQVYDPGDSHGTPVLTSVRSFLHAKAGLLPGSSKRGFFIASGAGRTATLSNFSCVPTMSATPRRLRCSSARSGFPGRRQARRNARAAITGGCRRLSRGLGRPGSPSYRYRPSGG